MFCDYHVHSAYSDDSNYLLRDVIERAILLGMEEIAICDHVDYGIKVDHDEEDNLALLNVDYPRYVQEIQSLQEEYKDKIVIRTGLEFGVQMHTREKYVTLFQRYEFDFIILSIHQVGDLEFWNYDFQENKSMEQYYHAYYQEMYDIVCTFPHYSVLGHMDLIKRYDKEEYPSFDNHKDMIKKILQKVILDGKGIEVNTSSVRYGLDNLTPSRDILKLYYELGGTILTIGSDSHEESHLGFHIENIKKELKDIGFQYFYTFDKMKAMKQKL